jgi:hypothetical protein
MDTFSTVIPMSFSFRYGKELQYVLYFLSLESDG